MQNRAIIDNRRMDWISNRFLHVVDITTEDEDQTDDFGQPIPSESTLYEGLKAQISSAGGDEVRNDGSVYGLHTHSILLIGVYPDIKTGMEVHTSRNGKEETYRVLLVEINSQDTHTRLQVERRAI
ncbi:hypothetical protein [Alkalicoccus chagannorensis]|uniref:hypothetical protein n=1 Tax=Alkalicoccus chagannorensis TaxID=427072 RepID=UPI00047CA116|nr:hypothetical protein [Alkalicoccus chagannorensis]